MENLKSSLFIIGNLLVFFSIYSFIPGLVDYFKMEQIGLFFVISIVCLFTGLNVSFIFKRKDKDVEVLSAFLLTLISWIILTFIGALPFYLGSTSLSLPDSFFESMSGLTTTGATVIQNLDTTSESILNLEGNASMAWRNWYNCDCYCYISNIKNRWYATFSE